MLYLIGLERLCARYCCLPKDILEEDAYFIRAFVAILKGGMSGDMAKPPKM